MTDHFNTKHGHSRRGARSKTYLTWCSMHRRCYLPSQSSWMLYGGRGIKVCEEWHKFENFLRDMGEQPEGMTLEREQVDGPYSKENCCWASPLEQARNKRSTRWLEYGGERLCLTEWAERLNIRPKTLRARLDDHGWSVERALTAPVMGPSESARHASEIRHARKSDGG